MLLFGEKMDKGKRLFLFFLRPIPSDPLLEHLTQRS